MVRDVLRSLGQPIVHQEAAHRMSATEISPGLVVQRVTPPLQLADFKLIAFDMDSTLINIECIDEIADAVGKKAEVAAITEATDARRDQGLQGKPAPPRGPARRACRVEPLQQVYDERLQAQPRRAPSWWRACKAAGLKVLLVSRRLHLLRQPRERRAGHRLRALQPARRRADGKLTGRVVHQTWGDICDGAEKRRTLLETCAPAGHLPQRRRSPWATAPTTCR